MHFFLYQYKLRSKKNALLHTFALTLAYIGAVLGVATVAPQILRTLRHPSFAGVAPTSWALSALGCSMWLVKGIRNAELPQIPGNVLLTAGSVAIALLV